MARPPVKININVTRIDKAAIVPGKNGKYIDLVLFEKDEQDQYGNDGFVCQEISKERREAGEKGPIIGNWKWNRPKEAQPQGASVKDSLTDGERTEDDDIPF